ncbi:uncharacterized protein BKCO1_5200067 [Diplodia corticola]|uniref:Uncharacterized protein n=1 Tax=Diplodia corticola TaxID=236234 RepID=A0A1J9QRP1_9PEZI|nr:uncharacterized protein BKCO1_5200067 [Diplodia corticola]OJD31089.1 hypothetical protein BKCO1_5200067 [Diplodia corticola]
MWSTNGRFLVAFALIAFAAVAMGLELIDLKSQRGRPKALAEAPLLDGNLAPRHPEPGPSTGRIETVDPQDLTTSLQDVVGSPSYTLPPVATGSTVHTGGVGGSQSTAAAPTTTSGVLGPNTTGSVPSGGNVVPDTASASGRSTGTRAASASASAAASAGASTSATTAVSVTASTSTSSEQSASQAEPSQTQSQGAAAADNVAGVGGVLGVVALGIGWLL